jgi:hypothetical protein
VVQGSIGRFGHEYRLNLKVIAASSGKSLAVFSTDADGERAVLDALHKGARSLKEQLVGGALTAGEAAETVSSGGQRSKAWIPVVAGGLAVVAGGIFLGSASSDANRLSNGDSALSSQTQVNALGQQGQSFQTIGAVLIGVGSAALVAGGAMYLLGSSDSSVAVVPQRGGVAASWVIRLP